MRRVSASGGSLPRWRRDGKELFYLAPDGGLMAVPTETKRGFEAGTPAVVFTANPPPDDYDVAPNGLEFLFLEQAVERDVPLTVVVNWAAGLKKP
jgi:eukaryotic-like serine/threonine-protein kinase